MSRLCVAIFVHDAAQTRRDMALAAEAGADMVELRVDHLPDPDFEGDAVALVKELVNASTVPVIITCRPTWEGGEYDGEEATRVDFLNAVAANDGAYLDIELAARDRFAELLARPRETRPGVILSTHDFKGRPARLFNLERELNESGADVNKVVWMARSLRDNVEAFEILQRRQRPTIALCMGEAGILSRVLARKFGAFLTFATLAGDAGTAPGQVSIHDMKRLYRWDALGPRTKVYGVVGSPVAHSMSPALHNAAFEQVGHDGVYLPMLVQPGYESFKAFMESFLAFEPLDLAGLSVTIPHKENALRYLKEKGAEVEELADRIGTVNTIVVERAGASPKLRGFNTDYAAILDTITSALGITRDDLKQYRVAVLGAGGTGRTAVAALAHYGATVVVYNRTKERADELAAEFDGRSGKVVAARLEKLCDSCCQVYVNTTSVGMHPNVDASPLDGGDPPKFTSDTLVFDTIYNPAETKLLRQAREAGAKTVGGIEMFVRQAAGQFEAWTQQPAPTDLMRRVVEEKLGNV